MSKPNYEAMYTPCAGCGKDLYYCECESNQQRVAELEAENARLREALQASLSFLNRIASGRQVMAGESAYDPGIFSKKNIDNLILELKAALGGDE